MSLMRIQTRSVSPVRSAASVLVAGLTLAAAPDLAWSQARTASAEVEASRVTIPLEHAVSSQHTATIKGQRVPYRATAGTLPVYDTEGNPIASVFYVFYERTDVQDKTRRPLMISFNGGPGSSSAWMHLGYTGPKRVNIDDEGNPVQPYGVRDNPESIIDVADIVYVDPVNVGFSRPLEGVDRRQFFGVNQDIDYLGRWIELFV